MRGADSGNGSSLQNIRAGEVWRNYKRDLKVQKAARAKEAIFITEGSTPQPGLNGQANAGDGDGGAHAEYDQEGDDFDLDDGSASEEGGSPTAQRSNAESQTGVYGDDGIDQWDAGFEYDFDYVSEDGEGPATQRSADTTMQAPPQGRGHRRFGSVPVQPGPGYEEGNMAVDKPPLSLPCNEEPQDRLTQGPYQDPDGLTVPGRTNLLAVRVSGQPGVVFKESDMTVEFPSALQPGNDPSDSATRGFSAATASDDENMGPAKIFQDQLAEVAGQGRDLGEHYISVSNAIMGHGLHHFGGLAGFDEDMPVAVAVTGQPNYAMTHPDVEPDEAAAAAVLGQAEYEHTLRNGLLTVLDGATISKPQRGKSEQERLRRQNRSERKYAQRALVAAIGDQVNSQAGQEEGWQPTEALGVGREGTSKASDSCVVL